jgi:hypothetical protein
MGSAGTLSARLTPTARTENRRLVQCTAAIPISTIEIVENPVLRIEKETSSVIFLL